MKIGIMQPYFLPYIGYWQLINAVDKYVIYDDVNYIKGGWINRNRILVNGQPKYFNIPMHGASPFKLINEVGISNHQILIDKNIRTIELSYKNAPYFDDVIKLINNIIYCNKEDVASYVTYSIKAICNYLEITTELITSSTIEKDNTLRGQDKVLSICKHLDASEYINAIGGQQLYSFEDFKKQGIKLSFLKTNYIEYLQFDNEFQPNLSILDVIMFNPKEKVKNFLNDYSLVN